MINLDMDGCVVNLPDHIAKAHGKPVPYTGGWWMHEHYEMTSEELWNPISTIEFWESAPKTEEADDIIRAVEYYTKSWRFCTHAMRPEAWTGKYLWVQKHYPQHLDKLVIVANDKNQQHTLYHDVLIDDNADHCAKWPGKAILVPRPWNNLYGTPVVKHIQNMLEILYVGDDHTTRYSKRKEGFSD